MCHVFILIRRVVLACFFFIQLSKSMQETNGFLLINKQKRVVILANQNVSKNMLMRDFEYFNPRRNDISHYKIMDMEPADGSEPKITTDVSDVNLNVIRALRDIIGQVYFGGYPLRMGKDTPVEVRFYHRNRDKNGKIINSKKVNSFVLSIENVLVIGYNNNTKTGCIYVNEWGSFNYVEKENLSIEEIKKVLRNQTRMMVCA